MKFVTQWRLIDQRNAYLPSVFSHSSITDSSVAVEWSNQFTLIYHGLICSHNHADCNHFSLMFSFTNIVRIYLVDLCRSFYVLPFYIPFHNSGLYNLPILIFSKFSYILQTYILSIHLITYTIYTLYIIIIYTCVYICVRVCRHVYVCIYNMIILFSLILFVFQ